MVGVSVPKIQQTKVTQLVNPGDGICSGVKEGAQEGEEFYF